MKFNRTFSKFFYFPCPLKEKWAILKHDNSKIYILKRNVKCTEQ